MGMPELTITVTQWGGPATHNGLIVLEAMNQSMLGSATMGWGDVLSSDCSGDTSSGADWYTNPCGWSGGYAPCPGASCAGVPSSMETCCDDLCGCPGVTVQCYNYLAAPGLQWYDFGQMCFRGWQFTVTPDYSVNGSTGVVTVSGIDIDMYVVWQKCPTSDQGWCTPEVPLGGYTWGGSGGSITTGFPKEYGPYGDQAAICMSLAEAMKGGYTHVDSGPGNDPLWCDIIIS